jgi:hypothetical protein
MTSAKGASGSGLTNVTAPPTTTRGSCLVRASARTGTPARRSMETTLV